MTAILRLALAIALVAVPTHASAVKVSMTQTYADVMSPDCTAGVCISAQGLDSTQYTGWVHIGEQRAATLGITFVDANDSVTALTMQCWTDWVKSGANGTGFEVCSGNTAAGTTTMTCPHTWSLTTGTAEQFTITVDNLNGIFLNCAFAATGTPAAADTVTVQVITKTP